MRALSVLVALAWLAAHAVSGFLIVFWATFPFENQSPEEAANDDWLIGVAVALFGLALLATLALVFRPRWSVAAYGLTALAGIALLVWALGVSEHSDGKLLLWGAAVEGTGLAAVALSRTVRET
jgi:hypothetical protein